MKLSHILILCSFSLITSILSYTSDAAITFFLQKYPYFQWHTSKQFDHNKYSKKLKQPTYVYKKITQSHNFFTHGVPGVVCLYAGRIALSDSNGQVIFPRRQQTSDIYLLITTGIQPAYMIAPTTVHNWMLDSTKQAEMYLMSLKHDEQTSLFYYETTQQKLPLDNNIPLNTIILITEPQNIFIPQGATIIDYSSNITLPIIYIKKGFCFVYNSLYTLAIKQYFEPTQTSIKQENTTVAQIEQTT